MNNFMRLIAIFMAVDLAFAQLSALSEQDQIDGACKVRE